MLFKDSQSTRLQSTRLRASDTLASQEFAGIWGKLDEFMGSVLFKGAPGNSVKIPIAFHRAP